MKTILLIDKPSGITSFDVIRRLRRQLSARKMGHAGTLDPIATGLMIIGVGEGTKKLPEYLKLDKEYVAEVLIGRRTATGDIEGEAVERREIGAGEAAEIFSSEKISAALASMTGTLTLRAPAYSAIKQAGVPLYQKARAAQRRGQLIPEADLPLRQMKVHEAELLNISHHAGEVILKTRFKVGSGTYIRSLAEELGCRLAPAPILPPSTAVLLLKSEEIATMLGFSELASLFNRWRQRQYRYRGRGYPATLKSLRRTKIGQFKIEDAEKI